MLIIVFHPSSVLVTVRAKKKKQFVQENFLPDNHFGRLPECGGLLQDTGYALLEFRVKIKTPVGNHYYPHGTFPRSGS